MKGSTRRKAWIICSDRIAGRFLSERRRWPNKSSAFISNHPSCLGLTCRSDWNLKVQTPAVYLYVWFSSRADRKCHISSNMPSPIKPNPPPSSTLSPPLEGAAWLGDASAPPRPRPARPQAACTFLCFQFVAFFVLFCFVFPFFSFFTFFVKLKDETKTTMKQFSKKQMQKKRLDYVC